MIRVGYPGEQHTCAPGYPPTHVVPVWLVGGMERARYLECLAADQAQLRVVAAADLTTPVPTCPAWTIGDLVAHVAQVYLHKAESMRSGATPQPWPPDLSGEEPLALLDRAYRALTAEFEARDDVAATPTWYDPDQTVGFWVRRMAQETVIHRIDAELAAGVPVADVPADLAEDGIDEVLTFLAYGTRCWPAAFTGLLPAAEQRVHVTTGDEGWLVRVDPSGVAIEPGRPAVPADAVISGPAADLLQWLWRRSGEEAIRRTGDPDAVVRLRQLLAPATQ